LNGRHFHCRLQVWHRAILPGDVPAPFGLLLCLNTQGPVSQQPSYTLHLANSHKKPYVLRLEVGGGIALLVSTRELSPTATGST
jgi:hypothetical protein